MTWYGDRQVAIRKATHEDYTIAILEHSSLGRAIDANFPFTARHVAALISQDVDPPDDFFEDGGLDHRRLLSPAGQLRARRRPARLPRSRRDLHRGELRPGRRELADLEPRGLAERGQGPPGARLGGDLRLRPLPDRPPPHVPDGVLPPQVGDPRGDAAALRGGRGAAPGPSQTSMAGSRSTMSRSPPTCASPRIRGPGGWPSSARSDGCSSVMEAGPRPIWGTRSAC